ncbi:MULTISPECIES: lytic polysaccharide monooxygenase [Providencia]|uniref:lytic polysaccharide monooxygenase n=1 Tax=Providencia TaxID=586 RepID=UPI0034DD9007
MKKTFITLSVLSISTTTLAYDTTSRHGYIDNPPSRAYLCSSMGNNLNKMCGAVQYEPQSVEGAKGFPDSGPRDGEIASGGNANFSTLNEQTAQRWHKVDIRSGRYIFSWSLTAPHRTTSWQFFITKPDWQQNKPLTRADFDLKPFCEQYDNGNIPINRVKIDCNIPERTGYQVILGVWTIADTSNAFYQVIDANMSAK